jgi:hypothetical protein
MRGTHDGAEGAPRWRAWLIGGALILGLGALSTGTGIAASTWGTSESLPAGAQAPRCAELTDAIERGEAINVGPAIQCDEEELLALETARQQARAQGGKPAMRDSPTCEAVNARAVAGDATLGWDLAFHCRQRERFANQVNVLNGNAEKQLTSLCRGIQARLERAEPVDRLQETVCGQEAEAIAAG